MIYMPDPISDILDVQSVDEDILQTEDKVMALKKAFVLFTKGDNRVSSLCLSQSSTLINFAINIESIIGSQSVLCFSVIPLNACSA